MGYPRASGLGLGHRGHDSPSWPEHPWSGHNDLPRCSVAVKEANELEEDRPVRGLAFGPRADASEDVHTLLGITARAEAERGWRLMGSRSQAEALSYLTTSLRRDWGIAALRCEAALRCRRAELLAGRAFGRRAQEMEEFDHARAAGEDFMRGVHARAGPAHRG